MRVLLVDGDLRRGKLNRFFDLPRSPGLTDVLSKSSTKEEAVHVVPGTTLSVLLSGTTPPNPSEMVASERMAALVAQLRGAYDLIVIDTPPVLAVTDGSVIGRLAGLNLLVVKSGRHPAREITLALRTFGRAGVRVNGIVLNDIRLRPASRTSRYGYHYQYDYR